MIFPLDHLGSVNVYATADRWRGIDIAEAVDDRARELVSAGLGPGDRAVLCQVGSGNFFADLLAVWAVGAAAAVLNPGLTADEIDNVVSHVNPKLALVGSGMKSAKENFAVPVVDFGAGIGPAVLPESRTRPGSLDDPALILFTSGTTGQPKGVVHTFRSLVARLTLNETFIGRTNMRQTLCTLPTHFGHGLIGNCLTPLLHGCDVTLVAGSDVRTVAKLGEIIDAKKITFMSSVPALWKMALKLSRPPENGTLDRVHIGSAPLSADL